MGSCVITHTCCLVVLLSPLSLVFAYSIHADGKTLPTREEVQKWIETNLETLLQFKESEVLKQADLDKLQPFLPPRYIDEFNFPEAEFQLSPSGDYTPHPDYRKDYVECLEPYEIRGQRLLVYRYDDPRKQDDAWGFLPQLHKIRRLSVTERDDHVGGRR